MNFMEGDVVDGGVEFGDYVVLVFCDVLVKVLNEIKFIFGICLEVFIFVSEGIGFDVVVVEEFGVDVYLYGFFVGFGKQVFIEDGEVYQVVVCIFLCCFLQCGEQVCLGVDFVFVYVFSQEIIECIF